MSPEEGGIFMKVGWIRVETLDNIFLSSGEKSVIGSVTAGIVLGKSAQ